MYLISSYPNSINFGIDRLNLLGEDMHEIIVEMEKIQDPYSGLGQFCLHLGNALIQENRDSFNIKFLIPESKKELFPSNYLNLKKIFKKIKFMSPKAQIWHSLHQDAPYWPSNNNSKIILTIHDLNFLYEKDLSSKAINKIKQSLQKKINRSSVVTFISQFTKSEVLKNFEIDEDKCVVIYNGIAMKNYNNPLRPKWAPETKFFFSIGTILPKKNFHTLVDLAKIMPNYVFILAGTTFHHYAKEIIEKINLYNLSNRFIIPGTISEEEKYWCYSNCEALLFPSKLEGFGIPVVEAMSLGKPIFLSKLTSLPEIGGDVSFYFDNFDPEHMKNTIQSNLKNPIPPQIVIDKSKIYSWALAAKKYIEIYNKLLKI